MECLATVGLMWGHLGWGCGIAWVKHSVRGPDSAWLEELNVQLAYGKCLANVWLMCGCARFACGYGLVCTGLRLGYHKEHAWSAYG